MYLMFIFTFVLLLFLDIITKTIAAADFRTPITVIDNFFQLYYVENKGAAWGIGQGKQFLFALIAIIFIGILIYVVYRLNPKYYKLLYPIAALMAGTLGNCIDRLFSGYVIDFLSFNIFGYAFPVFNIADICIVIGTFFIFLGLILIKDDDMFIKRKK